MFFQYIYIHRDRGGGEEGEIEQTFIMIKIRKHIPF